ncbi:MAG TPA: Asp-tRNA(Asn)/Glu-tRNA(Gln) amidotransferase subunit GatC [Bacteroidia bacterium]|jgi:aspartyl-tRNA(Asn)/glutamyl-tRNA(Gln) amidotransferase subunit C|nr:Asp-tRNA(Asn)/Glu-tRNA(Gln) amidotransferase subunit GatC [Bacteroidia bacterium]
MTKINEELINQLAHLARLEFNNEEKQRILNDLNRILDYIEQLNEVPTDNVEPLIYLSPNQNILREDEVIETLSKEEALANAPKKDSDYIRVPKVINQ